VRLVLALSVAALLAVFLLYTSIAGGGTPNLTPSQLLRNRHDRNVTLTGKVVGPVTGDAHKRGLRFRLRDIDGATTVPVVYHGEVPDLFRVGRHVSVDGRLAASGVFRGREPLVTKCPSKYAPKK
jgi:cytochrome c-type biogenesis protein CcmE